MDVQRIIKLVRRLAKSHEYQSMYSGCKELNFKLFKNDRDFSTAQINFLGYLNFYATICMDVYLNEVDVMVLDKEIYEDAYMYYKSKQRKEESNKIEHNQLPSKPMEKIKRVKSQWQFKGSN